MQNLNVNFLWVNTTDEVETLYWGQHNTALGEIIIAATEHGLSAVEFKPKKKRESIMKRLAKQWPQAQLIENPGFTEVYAERLLDAPTKVVDKKGADKKAAAPITLHIFGSPFQQVVWQELSQIPFGALSNYQTIAENIGNPNAVRAVGSAVGANPVALFIPCHRVILSDGQHGEYHWGKKLKSTLIEWEQKTLNRA